MVCIYNFICSGQELERRLYLFNARNQAARVIISPLSRRMWRLKVWWQDATLFVYFWFYNIHAFIQSQYIHPSPFAEASLHILIAGVLSGENFPVVPSRQSNSGLPNSKQTRCQLSHAAPLSHGAPYELRRTINVKINRWYNKPKLAKNCSLTDPRHVK